MARNSSGIFTLTAGNPVVTNTTITSTWANTTLSDIANELTNSLDRTGRGRMSVPILQPSGTVSLPAYSFILDPDTGLYSPSAGTLGIAVDGVSVGSVTSTGASLPGLLPNRNRVINGGMWVNQYGTTVNTTPAAVKYGGPDRLVWQISATTVSVTAFQSGQINGASSSKSSQLSATTTGATTIVWATRLPDLEVADLNNKQVTFTCIVSHNAGSTINFTPTIKTPTISNTFAVLTTVATGSATPVPTASPTRITLTVTLGASDATNGLQLQITSDPMAAQSGSAWATTDWQLTMGPTFNTVIDYKGYTYELLRCQRYFYVPPNVATGVAPTTTTALFSFPYPTEMRTSPSFTAVATTSNIHSTVGNVSIGGIWTSSGLGNQGVTAVFTRGAGTWTAGDGLVLNDPGNINPRPFTLSAEL